MNQFLIDGIMHRAVYRDVGTDHEERGGCWSFATKEVTECEGCPLQKACPADGDEDLCEDCPDKSACVEDCFQ